MPVDEGRGVSIITADDIRNHIGAREIVYWVFNDACPPSPGCSTLQNSPPLSASGISYARLAIRAISPPQTVHRPLCRHVPHRCNCYAPGDTTHAWHLDINTATSPDPSAAYADFFCFSCSLRLCVLVLLLFSSSSPRTPWIELPASPSATDLRVPTPFLLTCYPHSASKKRLTKHSRFIRIETIKIIRGAGTETRLTCN